MMRINRFRALSLVMVHDTVDGHLPMSAPGIVRRLCLSDNSAWIELTERAPDKFHPFPKDDPIRSHWVHCEPSGCKLIRYALTVKHGECFGCGVVTGGQIPRKGPGRVYMCLECRTWLRENPDQAEKDGLIIQGEKP